MEYSFSGSFGNLSSRISLQLRKVLINNLKKAEIEITPDEWFVISKLYHSVSSTQNDIAEHLGLSKVKVTRLIEQLERNKLIQRESEDGDRRFKNVSLTKVGKSLYLKVEPIAKKTLTQTFSGFSEDEQKIFLDFYVRILRNLD
ncbi:MAG: MarR family transcriptional regulator [Paludibacter sp.]|nr:MarR family transcriptional regulator [Paludibacter sp.]